MLLYRAHSWVLLLHWVPPVLTGLLSSLVPKLKTKMHHKGQITWLQTVSHHQKQTHHPILETHQLPVRNLCPCRAKSLPKAKGKRCPLPRRRGTTIRPLFYLLHIPGTCRVILLPIWLCFKGPLVLIELFIKCMNTAPVNLILKQYPGFEMNTAATSERKSHILLLLYTPPPKPTCLSALKRAHKPQKLADSLHYLRAQNHSSCKLVT